MNARVASMFKLMLIGCLAVSLPSAAQNGPPQQQQGRPGQGGQPPNQGGRPGGQNPGGGGGQRPPDRPPNRPPDQGNGRPGGNPPPRPGQPSIQPYPRPNPGPPQRPPQGRPPMQRPPQWGRPPVQRPPYHFRPGDRDYLRRYYGPRFGYINRGRRPVFVIGGFLPWTDFGYLTPVPPSVWGALPPIPYGYQAGYWDGYVIIYDPMTGYIAGVIDLLQ